MNDDRPLPAVPASPSPLRRVAVVGAGPRGIAITERLSAAAGTDAWQGGLELHLVDPDVGRGGAVWRADQSPVLLMNTATCQTTMYPDPSCTPCLPVGHRRTLADFLSTEGYAPADIAPRAAHGRYLTAVLDQAERDAAASGGRLTIIRHAVTAVDVTGAPDGPQTVHLASGESIDVDAVALALGHLATGPSPRSHRAADLAARHGLVHLPSANPLEVDYAALLGRERVAVQGMGLNFYDAIGMLTEVAGGRFDDDPSAPSGLRYVAGGREPQLVVGSRTGMVYRPKPDLRPAMPAVYEPRVLTDAVVDELARRPGGLEHERDTLPLLVAELSDALGRAGFTALTDEAAIMRLLFPLGRKSVAIDDAHRRTRAILREAVAAAGDPDPAWVLVFEVLTALRIRINALADRGAFTTGSYTRDIDGFLKNAFASWASGPPLLRARQALALEEAGLLVFTGPGFALGFDESARRFTVHAGEGPTYRCDAVLEAHLPGVDLERYTSPLIRAWRARGEVEPAILPSAHGDEPLVTGSIDVTSDGTLIGADRTRYPRRLLVGVPVSAAQPGSAITAEPGTSPQLLRYAEHTAIALARHAGALDADALPSPETAASRALAAAAARGGADAAPGTAVPEDAEAEDVPWAMQIVVLRDKKDLAADVDVAAAAARAVVGLLDDERAAPGGPWHDAVTRWTRHGRIRKLVRRADGKRWSDVQELPGLTATIEADRLIAGPAAARAFPPAPVRPLPHALDKLQVGGTTFERAEEGRCRDALVTIEVSPLIEITSGKLVAQVAHAAQRAFDLVPAAVRDAWRAQGFAVRVTRPDAATWAEGGRPVSITDAGFTELDGPTETTRARW
ncbi:FAD/NAD(P)-binding protein [Brachybacterium huguangmaarense]|uniref:FAD/NAD(P)-binding protein n=1 Tax=Brachybacterium huguangmaarense TaxID=1652028 RepID=A0ABY6G0V7_9MICO|nr:FAD/NAD(P)-binding protein [Brachybacterium huguangmaarense]UYG16818.1 FAD/NAD(P)-binding protein [Brachybacterium huguangmaarense]